MSRPRSFLAGLTLMLVGCSRTSPETAGPDARRTTPPIARDAELTGSLPPPLLEPGPTGSLPPPLLEPGPAAPAPITGDAKKEDVARIIEEATRIARGGGLVAAIKRLDDALMVEPENREALYLSASLLQDQAQQLDRPKNNALFHQSAEGMRRLRAAHKNLNPMEARILEAALYNDACTYAVEYQPDNALDTLAEAASAGFAQLALLDDDEELASIRKDPKFQEIRNQIVERAKTQAKDRARSLLAEARGFRFDFTLPDLDDKPVALSDLKGKVAVVDVWGTWVPPCRKEVPHLVALYKIYHDKGLEIVGLNYERVSPEDAKATIKAFVDEHKIPYPCLIGDNKTQEEIPDFQGYPTTLFVDRSGKVRARLAGYEPGQERLMEELVTALLNESLPESTPGP